ncbi:MAG TPA: DUF1501 domain-containing protein [Phycisphaerae bacterium]
MSEFFLTTRREFLHRGLYLIGVGATIPSFLERTAWAFGDPTAETGLGTARLGTDDRVLVVIQLAGGNDGLNTLIPFRADPYFKARPRLAIPKDEVLKINDEWGLHPAAKGLKSLLDDGQLAIIHGVGYPNPNRSHFKSTDIWSTASPDGRLHEGWIGRYFDNCCKGADPCDPQSGIAIVGEEPLAMLGEKFHPVAFQRPDTLTIRAAERDKGLGKTIEEMNAPVDEPASSGRIRTLDFLRRTAMDARVSSDQIRKTVESNARPEFGRNGLAQSLQMVAKMIAAKMPTRVYYVSLGGFDTHSNQAARHRQLLEQLGSALQAFVAALKESGHWDRTLVMTFSEFGRRVAENASGGTDHGAAAPLLVAGGAIKPGLLGKAPSFENLVNGDLAHTVDFRTIYAAVLGDWFKADANKILGGKFERFPILNHG